MVGSKLCPAFLDWAFMTEKPPTLERTTANEYFIEDTYRDTVQKPICIFSKLYVSVLQLYYNIKNLYRFLQADPQIVLANRGGSVMSIESITGKRKKKALMRV